MSDRKKNLSSENYKKNEKINFLFGYGCVVGRVEKKKKKERREEEKENKCFATFLSLIKPPDRTFRSAWCSSTFRSSRGGAREERAQSR